MNFAEVSAHRPPSHVVVPAEAWATSWEDRPEEEVCIGLRYVAEGDLEDARIEALRRAEGLFPNHEQSEEHTRLFIASFQDGLIRFIIGRGTCDPNDVRKSWSLWSAAPEDMAKDTLTDIGAQIIFDHWEKMRIENDIGTAAATDEDLTILPELLTRLPALGAISRSRELRLRRLLRFILEELETVEVPAAAAAASADVDEDAEEEDAPLSSDRSDEP